MPRTGSPTRPWRYADLAVRAHPEHQVHGGTTARHTTMASLRDIARGHPLGYGHMESVKCPEHQQTELVPVTSYWDCAPWYAAGRHPRWSLVKWFLDHGQRHGEIHQHMRTRAWGATAGQDVPTVAALRAGTSPAGFARRIAPHLFVWLRHQGRRVRVRQAFANAYRAKRFTAQQWLDEPNQELRRMMLRRGVEPPDIQAKLGDPLATDAEGTLYWYRGQRYLAVTCPSTGTPYLLGVPTSFADRVAGTSVLLDTPAKARRWTFNLPMDAAFAAEA